MIEVIKKDYWSRSDAFILPLTGLPKDHSFEMKSYLYWRNYSIEDYKLILSFSNSDEYSLRTYCKSKIYPVLDKEGYLLESYDEEDKEIYVLDISKWGPDIEKFLRGKYSHFSTEAKSAIEKFHMFDGGKISVHIYAVLYPFNTLELLNNKSPIQYVADNYGINYDTLCTIGELGSIYNRAKETLEITNVDVSA